MKDNFKIFISGVVLTSLVFSGSLNFIAYKNGFLGTIGKTPVKIQETVSTKPINLPKEASAKKHVFSGVGYSKKDAEEMLALVESVQK